MIVALSAGRDSSPELLARIALDEDAQRTLLRTRRPGLREVVVLSTCHRTEIYADVDVAVADAVHEIAALLPLEPADQHEIRLLRGVEAVEHLYRVAAGLDSLVIGEPQIAGQVRRALRLAEQEGAAGSVLVNVFARALRVARRAREGTSLGSLRLSIGTLVTDHLAARLHGLEGRTAAVVGAGEAARDAATALRGAGARVAVLARDTGSGARLASLVDGDAHPLGAMPSVMAASDCAVVAVHGGVVVRDEHIRPRTAPLFMVDVSVPASVDVRNRMDVVCERLHDLKPPQSASIMDAVSEADTVVAAAVADYERWSASRAGGRTAADLRAFADRVIADEVARASAARDLTDEDRQRLARLAARVAAKLLHGPLRSMRDGDEAVRAVIRDAFDLEG